jgi:hypothetical protein
VTFLLLALIVTLMFGLLAAVGWWLESRPSKRVKTSAPHTTSTMVIITFAAGSRAPVVPSIHDPVPIVRFPPQRHTN